MATVDGRNRRQSQDRRAMIRVEFEKDHGNCYYCSAHFRTPGAWFTHLKVQHPGTIRTLGVVEVVEGGTLEHRHG